MIYLDPEITSRRHKHALRFGLSPDFAGLFGISRNHQRSIAQDHFGVLFGPEDVFPVYEAHAGRHAGSFQTGRDYHPGCGPGIHTFYYYDGYF